MTELQCMAIVRDLGISAVAVSEPSSGPLGISLATRGATHVLSWASRSKVGQGNQICFLLVTWCKYREQNVPDASLNIPPNSLAVHREGCCCVLLQLPLSSVEFPGLSVAKGMFFFKLWWVSMLSRHPGGLTVSFHTAFPPRRKVGETDIGDSRRWGWRYKRKPGVAFRFSSSALNLRSHGHCL